MDRDSSTRPARFRQAVAERHICRGGRKGGYQTWQKCLVAGANGVVGRLLRDPHLEELFWHSARHPENSGRCLQLATGSIAEGIFPTEEETRRQEIPKVEAQPAREIAHERDRRSIHASETVDAAVVLDRADPDLGEAIRRPTWKADPLEEVSTAGLGWNDDQYACVGKIEDALRGREEWEVQAPNAGPDADAATAAGPHAMALCGGSAGSRGTHDGRGIVEFFAPERPGPARPRLLELRIVSSDPKAKGLLRHPPVETNQAASRKTSGVRRLACSMEDADRSPLAEQWLGPAHRTAPRGIQNPWLSPKRHRDERALSEEGLSPRLGATGQRDGTGRRAPGNRPVSSSLGNRDDLPRTESHTGNGG